MSQEPLWRWADKDGQQRLVRADELRVSLANGVIPPNAPVWRPGWKAWITAYEVPELSSSALSAMNGLVPNIPPPPMFVIATQAEYESKNQSPAEGVSVEEPPPPPRYVPALVKSSPATIPPAAPSSRPRLSPEPSAPAPAASAVAPSAVAPTATASAAVGTEAVEAPMRAKQSTLMMFDGVQPVEPPNTSASPAPSAAKSPSPNAPIVAPGSGDRPAKNSVTRPPPWNGGEVRMRSPESTEELGDDDILESAPSPSAPRVVAAKHSVPPPLVKRTSITPPPIKAVSTPVPRTITLPPRGKSLPPPVPKHRSFIPAPEGQDSGSNSPEAKVIPPVAAKLSPAAGIPATPNPVPDPKGAPRSVPPPTPHTTTVTTTLPPVPLVASSGFGPDKTPDTTGLTPPPESSSAVVSASELIDDDTETPAEEVPETRAKIQTLPPGDPTKTVEPMRSRLPSISRTELPLVPPMHARMRKQVQTFVDGVPALKRVNDRYPTVFIPVLGVTTGVLGLLCLIGLVNAASGSGDKGEKVPTPITKISASAFPSVSASVAPSVPSASAVASVVAPPPSAVTSAVVPPVDVVGKSVVPCTVALGPKKLGPRALVANGVEVGFDKNTFAVGYTLSEHDGQVVKLTDDLVFASAFKARAGAKTIVRVLPRFEGNALKSVFDVSAGALNPRRSTNSLFDFGVADGQLVAAKHGTDSTSPLWPLEGDAAVEALRVYTRGDGNYALAFRRGGKIVHGLVKTAEGKAIPDGAFVSHDPVGARVGSPQIAMNGSEVMLVWAEQSDASSNDSWGLRVFYKGNTKSFAVPSGGPGAPIISPALAPLEGGRTLLVWTEGKGDDHQVRAITLDATGAPIGAPLQISEAGTNAGQGQAAVTPTGTGVVAFLAGKGKALDVMTTRISCP